MRIILNGEDKPIADYTTAKKLITDLGLADRRLALEINKTVLPRSEFDAYVLQQGDQVEIVHAIGGG